MNNPSIRSPTFFGETDNVNLDVRVLRLVLVADLFFKLMRELLVVQRQQLALIGRVRVRLLERHVDDARLEVVGDQPPYLPGLEHVVAQLIKTGVRAVVALWNDFAPGKALLGNFGPAHAGAPERFKTGTVHAGNVKYFVTDLAQGLHIFFGENVAIHRFYGNAHRIAQVRQIVAVLHHVLNERMRQRDHLFETGGRPNLRGLPEQKNTRQQAEDNHGRTMIENQALKKGCLVI
ncbi:hypothetical protein TOC8171_34280 [Pseudomonas syringae]